MQSSNNNRNTLDPNEEHDGGKIDRLDLLIKYQAECAGQACKQRGQTQDKEEEEEDVLDFYVTDNPRGPLDKNVSFSETRLLDDKQPGSLDRRTSSARKLKTIFDNTYRMEPKPEHCFISYKAKAVIASVMGPLFANFEYESKAAANLCKLVCSRSLLALRRKYDWPRHRFVCLATIVQLKQQGVIIGERCLWNTPLDSAVVCKAENKTCVLVVTLHAIYFE